MSRALLAALFAIASLAGAGCRAPELGVPQVRVVRVPGHGLQPEGVTTPDGAVHVVYLAGAPSTADVMYVRSTDRGASFSTPQRVDLRPGSAIATGTVRGAQIAIGAQGRVHVAWNGSAPVASPGRSTSGPSHTPFWYARTSSGATAFETPRDLIEATTDLDGGGALAADGQGHVYAAWHGRPPGAEPGEQHRRVWLRRSSDSGDTFLPEAAIGPAHTGVCGCCALRLAAGPDRTLHLLYRAAVGGIHRDVIALTSRDGGGTFDASRVDRWDIAACPMTSMAIAATPPTRYAWETDGQVYLRTADGDAPTAAPASGPSPRRKHPRLAVASDGTVLMTWTEGTAWGRGGRVAWQVFDAGGGPLPGGAGTAPDLPAWSFAAPLALPDGSWLILY